MNAKLLMLMLGMLCFQIIPVFSQQVTIRGKILDESDLPLPGANVLIKGTSIGTVSDMDGGFVIEAPNSESILVFSYLGYVSKEIQVGGQTSFNISLEPDLSNLEEVVVVGYGTQRKIETTGAIASIKSDELTQTPVANVAQGLQGRVSGVQVVQNSSAPGGNVSVRVRGTNSIRGSSEPLYIIDGVQISNGGGVNELSPLSTINPNDIESVQVLKDASSTAIYGARGANGVVIVTTKRGSAGKTVVTYDGYFGVQSNGKKLDVLNANQFALLENEVYNRPVFPNPENEGVGTDWQDIIFRQAPIQSHQLSVMFQAHGLVVTDGLVDVGGRAAVIVRANGRGRTAAGGGLRCFCDEIDRTAGGTTAGGGRGGTLGDLDLLKVEAVASVAAEVAHAVDEHVGARTEAANRHLVAGGVAAFAGLEGDTGGIA